MEDSSHEWWCVSYLKSGGCKTLENAHSQGAAVFFPGIFHLDSVTFQNRSQTRSCHWMLMHNGSGGGALFVLAKTRGPFKDSGIVMLRKELQP